MPWKLVRYQEGDTIVSNPEEILSELEILGSVDEQTVNLVSESGDRLSISVSGPEAFVMFTAASDDQPPLSPMSAGRTSSDFADDVVEFIAGGTPTPVPVDRCVSVSIMLKIVRHYLEHGALPDWIDWQDQ
jgi:hypothetical protein